MTISRETVADLARADLVNNRPVRYRAEEQGLALSGFAAADREQIVSLYAMLIELDGIVSVEGGLDDAAPLTAFSARHGVGDLVYALRRLGAGNHDPRIAEALHDIRGGALTALFVQLSRAARVPYRSDMARGIAIGTRDHLKIMRNVVPELDAPARERDLALRPHSLGELASALREFTATVGSARVVAAVDCPDEEAIIAETCVECAAVDRVAYNLLNNAARYASRPAVDVSLALLERDLRVAVANPVSEEQRLILEERLASDPASLFEGFTTSGSGFGLRIVSDLVARAYGVASLRTLTAEGYVGARVVGDTFVSWFHWPLSTLTAR